MLQFDQKGLLTPDKGLPCTLEAFRQIFVEHIPDDNRKKLYEGLLVFLKDMVEVLQVAEILVWIDGSFTTLKWNPNDIDLVYFLTPEKVIGHEKVLKERFSSSESIKLYGIDAYLVQVYPENHSLYSCTLSDRAYWNYFFTKTRKDKRGISHKKGFLELNISRHDIIS